MFKRVSIIALFAVLMVFSGFTQANAQDGKALFQANCASCHNPVKDATGPALQGITGRAPSTEWIHKWVRNSAALIASGDKHANEIYNKWNKTAMTAFPSLKDEEIDAIVKYVEEYKVPVEAKPEAGGTTKEADNTWIYVLVTIILAILALILIRINKGLHKVANTEQGIPNTKDVPLKRNKVFIAITGILVLILAGYWMVNGGVEMGRQQNYMPKQPIFYSHKVHAGVNQINCQYCHAGVNDSRQAMIPSTNVCMNCHKQISEYTGEQLFDHEGNKVDGTAQIQELYKYAGWDAAKKDYKRDAQGKIQATPIKWTKIHNLADFVYFNHSQHVNVGKVQCQTCHGPIQEMDEVKQFESLSMGWCINCHRETKVDFKNNNYYSIFEKYHQEIKDGKRDGVTEAELGGLECQKCHY
ncbi:cytochrome C [Taibaiella sp. KBW10]|uniref:c-type cytochrome n=1 Tax=Taibaiella sp. KBW10 TaxID=2153357 RepID=UPI000F5923D3|nr:c-type cytochrome [Taibaiella sp. KBW10]RQO30176.1 cytochrome C [Taibaiella sp. KBW10]